MMAELTGHAFHVNVRFSSSGVIVHGGDKDVSTVTNLFDLSMQERCGGQVYGWRGLHVVVAEHEQK
jgi:hypothetical protein